MKKTIALIISLMMIMIFSGCGADSVDSTCLSEITGEYRLDDKDASNKEYGEWWHLSITDDEEYGKYFAIYDVEAGNPGVEGNIISLDKQKIKIEINQELYDQLPSGKWKCDDRTLELNYIKTDDGIELSNNGSKIKFVPDVEKNTWCGRWKSNASKKLSSFEIGKNHIIMEGMVYEAAEPGVGGIWSKMRFKFNISPTCRFTDNFFGNKEISADEFAKLLARDDAAESVIEVDAVDDEALEVRLEKEDKSSIPN